MNHKSTKSTPKIYYKAILPGPDRKRKKKQYQYKLTYKNPCPYQRGCLLVWEVKGGREPYQISIERTDNGEIHSHCTCADAIYRGDQPGHVCKHILGFLQFNRDMRAKKLKDCA